VVSSQESIISARIRSARKSRQWSQKDLAAAAGVAEGTVARVERGEKVRPGNLYSIRVTLGLTEDEPQERTEMPPSVQLALDITQKWLLAQPTEEARDAAANDLTRYIVSRM
jgi:transcriptional regulator with XRE-family HTH domain